MDGWNTSLSHWVSAYFQGRAVSFREGMFLFFEFHSLFFWSLELRLGPYEHFIAHTIWHTRICVPWTGHVGKKVDFFGHSSK